MIVFHAFKRQVGENLDIAMFAFVSNDLAS